MDYCFEVYSQVKSFNLALTELLWVEYEVICLIHSEVSRLEAKKIRELEAKIKRGR